MMLLSDKRSAFSSLRKSLTLLLNGLAKMSVNPDMTDDERARLEEERVAKVASSKLNLVNPIFLFN